MANKTGKKVWVRPLSRGQRPDGVWTDEGGAPFQVGEKAVSEKWQALVDDDEAKELDAAAQKAAKAQKAKHPTDAAMANKLKAVTAERDELKAKVEKLTAELKEATENAKTPEPEKPPASSVMAGDKK